MQCEKLESFFTNIVDILPEFWYIFLRLYSGDAEKRFMAAENVRERKQKRRYTFVVVPDAKAEKTRTFSASLLGLIGTVLATFLVIVALIFAAIIYTPVGTHLPISSPEIVKQYGKQIIDIRNQLQSLVQEITVLRGYNVRLRRAMGEKISGTDSSALAGMNTLDSPLVGLQLAQKLDANPMDEKQEKLTSVRGTSEQPPATIARMVPRDESMDFISRLPLSMPVDGFISRGFDAGQFHYGIDVAGKQGTPIFAAADGHVLFAGWTYDDGFLIMLAHDNGYMTVYKHNQSILKSTGDPAKRGEIVALLGNTGRTSSGPHLHFEVWKDGIAHDPNHYILHTQ